MRITIELPDDIHERIAVEALKKPRNSKEAVITEILRAYYGGGQPHEKRQALLAWRIPSPIAQRIHGLRRHAKARWT
jgi:hypothetical protein